MYTSKYTIDNAGAKKILPLQRDFLISILFRKLKHTVNKVQSLQDFLTADIYRMLKHTVNKVQSLRDFA
jgi:hypothetical protein